MAICRNGPTESTTVSRDEVVAMDWRQLSHPLPEHVLFYGRNSLEAFNPMNLDEVQVRVTCTTCAFEEILRRGTDRSPTDVIIAHGRDTGHALSVTSIDK